MPKFQVLRRVDAFVDYVTDVEADSAEEAAQKADRYEEAYGWQKQRVLQFDARSFLTLDDDGVEIEATQRGDF